MSNWMVTYNSDDLIHYGTKGHSGVYVRKNKKQQKQNKNNVRFSTDDAMRNKALSTIYDMINLRYGRSQQGLKEKNLSDDELAKLVQTREKTIKNAFKALSIPAKKRICKKNKSV